MKIGNETEIRKSVNRAAGSAYNAVRLSSASPAERTVCNGRTTDQVGLVPSIHGHASRLGEGSSQVGDRTGQSTYPYDPAGDVVVLGEHARFLIDIAEHSLLCVG
jgi:hypothetical protein